MNSNKERRNYEKGDLEDDYSGDCEHTHGSTDSTGNDLVYGLWTHCVLKGMKGMKETKEMKGVKKRASQDETCGALFSPLRMMFTSGLGYCDCGLKEMDAPQE